MTVDWEGLRSLEAKCLPTDQRLFNKARFLTLLEKQWPTILAAHERDQRVIEAAEKLRHCFEDLYAMVKGECPSLLEDYFMTEKYDVCVAEYDKAKQS